MAENNSLSFLADQYTINKTPEKWRESEEEILTAKRKKRQSRERRRKNTAALPALIQNISPAIQNIYSLNNPADK